MAISEQSRHAMYVRLESALGQEAALILMEHLPPVGWADVATKRDLDHLHTQIQRDLAVATAELRSELYDRTTAQTRTLVFAVLGSSAAMAAVTLSATRLG